MCCVSLSFDLMFSTYHKVWSEGKTETINAFIVLQSIVMKENSQLVHMTAVE